MGMFDNVICEVPLPDGKPHEGEVFQTKDFECPYLEYYTIRADGRLMHEKPRWPIDGPDEPHGLRDTNFHGILNFYSYDDNHEWREFNAKFTDGNLVGIEIVSEDLDRSSPPPSEGAERP